MKPGRFSDEGIEVELVPFSAGKDGLDAVLNGKLDFCIVADLPIVLAVLKEKPVAIVGTIFSAEKDHRLVARRDRGIVEPPDLRGKTIGVTLGTTADLILELVLNAGKLKRRDINIISLNAEDIPSAILRGELDAVAVWEPYLSKVVSGLGANSVIFDGFDVQGMFTTNLSLVTTKSLATKNPEVVEKILRSIIRAQQFIRQHPNEVHIIVEGSTGLSNSAIRKLWTGYRFEVRLDQSLLISLEDTARWAIKNHHGNTITVPNFSENIFPEQLSKIDPGSVRIIR